MRHPVQFTETPWEIQCKATRKYNRKHNTNITVAEYVRIVSDRAAKRQK